ncbi:MAG: hypothetical protein J6U85_03775 [Bacteroidales bacterium]|nr:hypothetical protein [Bacteroidales bacterium]
MKRIGKTSEIIDKICEYHNISQSIDVVLHGRKRKRQRAGKYIIAHRDEVIAKLQKEIREGTFALTGYREYQVTDGPKVRKVQSINIYERIGCNAIMHVTEKYLFKRYIRTTGASIRNRGMHDLKSYIQRDIELDPKGTKYCYKFDIKKFYESIDQEFMMYALRRIFKDRILLTIFERFVYMMPQGLSIGLRSSQGFGNLLLSMFLDHYLKDELGVKHFYRYCDDGVVLAGNKKELWEIRNKIHKKVSSMGLEIKSNERVFPTRLGIDFLGYVIYGHDNVRLRKRNKKRAARKLHKIKSKRRRQEVIASLYGQCKHANCINLFKKLTGMSMLEFKRLSDTGIKAKYQDGKKRFEGNEINISELVGEEFLIVDFETNIITKPQRREYEDKVSQQRRELENYTTHGITPPDGFLYPEKVQLPIGKYLVSVKRNVNQPNEVIQKLFTGDGENKSILDQMREHDLLGKVLCSVKSVRCKGFNRYIFT